MIILIALLQLSTFVYNIAIDDVYYALLQMKTFACIITIDNFCMHYWYWKLLFTLLHLTLLHRKILHVLLQSTVLQLTTFVYNCNFCNWQLFYALKQIKSFAHTITIDKFTYALLLITLLPLSNF